jgi:hypothetical protein
VDNDDALILLVAAAKLVWIDPPVLETGRVVSCIDVKAATACAVAKTAIAFLIRLIFLVKNNIWKEAMEKL